MQNKMTPQSQYRKTSGSAPVLRLLAGVLAIAHAFPASADQALPASLAADGKLTDKFSRSDINLREIVVDTDRNNLPADGRGLVNVQIRLLDEQGRLLQGLTYVSVKNSGGRILEAQRNNRFGPGVEVLNSGTQIKVENGIGKFTLMAPTYAQDVKLRVSSGSYEANGVVSFMPDLRPMIVSGLVEGIISRRPAQDPNSPSRFNDGFEQAITRWSRQFNNGRTSVAERAAFFAKGEVGDGMLLTASYDSDKSNYSRLLKDIDPNRFYPVYGDTSLLAFDAQSSDRLYLRLDDRKSYLLYGDFSTGSGFTQITTGGSGIDPQINQLGQYNRSATGLRGHYEEGRVVANGFAINDTLKQVVEEYPANGTSGPFTVRNNTAIQNSEQVQLLIRDKNQTNVIKQVIVMQRYVDYSFEPLSGRILFNQPIASLSADGDPQSLRITYEADQGGDKFWVVGADGKLALSDQLQIGASVVDDQNPQSPYKLQSVGGLVRFSANTSLVLEMARSSSTTYSNGSTVSPTPTGAAGEMSAENTGNARRIEFNHKDEQTEARAYWLHADEYFNNTSGGLAGGRTEAGVSGRYALNERTRLYAEYIRSEDQASAADRSGERIGVSYALTDRLRVNLSVQHMKDSGNFPSGSTIASNTAPLGTGQNPTGGFFGSANNGIDPVTGQQISPVGNLGNTNNPVSNIQYSGLDATTVKVAAVYQLNPALTINGDLERSVSGDDKYRYGLGAQYAISPGNRLYARAETQSGLASSYSLNPADRSSSLVAGSDTSYMPGGTLFSEVRMLNQLDTSLSNERENQLASGVRNNWKLNDDLNLNTSFEVLKVLDGSQQQAVAMAVGGDYRLSPQSSLSAKLEFRHLYDNSIVPGDQSQSQWLSTVSYARKVSSDWTFLTRNYLMLQQNHDNAGGSPIGNAVQDRAQIGFAWRPRDNNLINGLARYEYKTVRDHSQQNGDDYTAHILSGHMDYHPQRAWWMNLHAAAKLNTDYTLPAGQQKYNAALLSGRAIYDINPKWDVGVLVATMYSPQGSGRQYAYGTELGYQLVKNMYVSVGYNLSGFTDKDLTGADYTAHGLFLRLRYKFDENLFKGKSRD